MEHSRYSDYATVWTERSLNPSRSKFSLVQKLQEFLWSQTSHRVNASSICTTLPHLGLSILKKAFFRGATLSSLRPGYTASGSNTSGSSFCNVCIWIIFDDVIVPPQHGAKFQGTKLKNGGATAHKIKNGQKLLAEIRKLCVCVFGGKSPKPFCFDLRKVCF